MWSFWRGERAGLARARNARHARGYALMLALVLTAGVLGASSLLLSRVKEFRERARLGVHVGLVTSALQSAERVVVAREHARAERVDAPVADRAPWTLTVGRVKVDVTPRVAGQAVVHSLHAQWAGTHRRSDVCTVWNTALPAGAPPDAAALPAGCLQVGPPPAPAAPSTPADSPETQPGDEGKAAPPAEDVPAR
jgi:hypothetical protein